MRFDTGGIGKGLAADLLAERLGGYARFVVDCGGDLRVGGFDADRESFEVLVEHPLTGELGHAICARRAAPSRPRASTSASGGATTARFAHHLLDPSTGEPAWTGLVGATALAGTALEAETLSKAALLSAPRAPGACSPAAAA